MFLQGGKTTSQQPGGLNGGAKRSWHPTHGSDIVPIQLGLNDKASSLAMVKKLWKYVWPEDRPHIRRRVSIAVGLLIASKLLNVVVPFIFGATIDLLNKNSGVAVATDATAAGLSVIFALVVGCTCGCGCHQSCNQLFMMHVYSHSIFVCLSPLDAQMVLREQDLPF